MAGRNLGRRLSKRGALALVAVAYLAAVGGAWVVASVVGPHRPVVALGLGYLAAALIIYVWSLSVDNGSMFDAWWSVLPAFAALWLALTSSGDASTVRSLFVLVVVWAWSLRLTANWARSWPGLHHEDWRYGDLYAKGPKPLMSLTTVHVVPAGIVFLLSLSFVPALVWGHHSVGGLDGLALVVGLGGVALEFVADEQMRTFTRHNPAGTVMDHGLWRFSRHPNYFGEILFWLGVWIFGVAAHPSTWWMLVGPLVLVAMFLGASIPLLDQRSRERRPAFDEYARRTSALVPWLPRTSSTGVRHGRSTGGSSRRHQRGVK